MNEEIMELSPSADSEEITKTCDAIHENGTTLPENLDNDYEALIEKDLEELRNSIPGLEDLSDISELENPVRYGALRDLGLSPREAYMATTGERKTRSDNRAHLRSSVPRAVHSDSSDMPYRELALAREIFSGVSDAEIQRLYKKVTK
jgi:hypothetical protein